MKSYIVGCVLFLLVLQNEIPKGNTENILVLAFFSSKSHKATFEPLIHELAERGHSITCVNPFKSAKPHKNIKDIIGKSFEDSQFLKDKNMFEMKIKNENVINPFVIATSVEEICRSYYNMSEVMKLKDEKFDVIFVSSTMNECTYGLVHHLNAPFIFLTPFSPPQFFAGMTGTPSPSSFVPVIFLGYTDNMTFFQRVTNMIMNKVIQGAVDVIMIPKFEKIYRDIFGEKTPSVYEIQKNVSLILANSHLTLSYARPLMPDIIEVGGMACRPAKPLPKDLEDFLTGAGEDGAIFFSMGSILQAKTMPESYRKLFVNVFSKLKQRVLWKWEAEEMEDLPKNVKLGKWLPQQDVLGHPNVKAFITHGGLGSIVEAVYHGVPLIGIPMFGDQSMNLKQSADLGFGLPIEFNDLTEESFLATINAVLNEPKYTQRAQELSVVYRDRPQNPLETAVYWSEYVMRHKGAKHLRSPARDLNWIQYHSLDSVAFVITILLFSLYILLAIFKFFLKKCCAFGTKVSKIKKEN